MDLTEIESVEDITEVIKKQPGVLGQYFQSLLPKALSFGIELLISVLIWFIGTKIIKAVIKSIDKLMLKKNVDEGVRKFMGTLLKVVLYLLIIMLILNLFGVTTASVVAVLGSAGLTIGLALQGALANFAGGVLILVNKPFTVGDYVILADGAEGTVKEISIICTKLETPDLRTVVVPNGNLANSRIINASTVGYRRLDIEVGVSYDQDLKAAKKVLLDVADKESRLLADKQNEVIVKNFGASSIDLELHVWVDKADYLAVKFDLHEAIRYAFIQNNIEIPYNQLDVHMK